MTETKAVPEPEVFAAAARKRLREIDRSWPWLSKVTDIHVNTLRSQLIEKPSRLKLGTARRVSTALDLTWWGDAA